MNDINTIIIFLLLLVIFFLFFHNLMNKVDHKLNNLKVNVNSSPVKVELPKEFTKKFIIESKKYDTKDGEEIDKIEYDKTIMEDSDFLLEGFDQYQNKNREFENKQKSSHMCFKDHKHTKCNLGIMNYPEPNDLSSMDYQIFKINYPPNMTMQDYVNWLYCYKDDESQLPYNHLKNLDKLKRNIPLEEIKGVCPPPGYESSPLESSKYFDKIYGSNNEFKIASHLNSQTGPIMAYNNDEYSEFSQNLDVQGTSSYIRNCDIGLKKTSKELNDFVFPKDSNNLEETEKNKIYFQKNVEI